MITSNDCFKKYGEPELEKNMVVWDIPNELEIGVIPKKLYCNKDLVEPLKKALTLLISRGVVKELKTWDGCFNIRKKRGLSSMSLHSWGLAIDVNAAWNGLGKEPMLSKEFVECFTDSGFDWGGTWRRKDGMHFQLSMLPLTNEVLKSATINEHVVQKGDTLSKIAAQYKTTITKIQKDNNLVGVTIYVGQKLKV